MNENVREFLGIPEEKSLVSKTLDVIKHTPIVSGLSLASYLLDQNAGLPVPLWDDLASPESKNIGYHAGVGLGIYGSTCEGHHVKGSLALLATTLIPDLYTLSQDGDLTKAGLSATTKLIGYGTGFIVGKTLKKMSEPSI